MITTYNALIIEDHPLIVDAYKQAFIQFSKRNKTVAFNVDTANDCDSAIFKINEAKASKDNIDLVFLDIKIPPSKNGEILSGEDLGVVIRTELPDTKIIVATTFSDNYRINTIFRNVNPEGFLVKNDLSSQELVLSIDKVLYGETYYCKTVIELMRKQVSNEIVIDAIDRKLLFELSQGCKMSELPDYIPLSLAALERRKRHLKEIFGLDDKSDRELLRVAAEKGFI
ncbi:hypothetical protein MHTCC0001_10450 [Flavobacteriaceae bacterium MHTCC 0001]